VLLRTFEAFGAEPGFAALVRKTLGVLLTILSLIWLLGIASGGRSLLQPLGHLARANTAEPSLAIAQSTRAESRPRVQLSKDGSAALVQSAGQPVFKRVRTVAELEAALVQTDRPVMLDFYADWCVSCKEMEAFTFTDPRVAQRLGQLLLLQADVTANSPEDRALLKRYRLFGPPGIIFFDPTGRERKDVRVIGFQDATRFAGNLDRLLTVK
jgi:thiol:disulfide interchange protein DsbD